MRQRERYEKRVGSVVDGRWRIDALLGAGSTAAVYAATHRNGHRAALKIIHQSLCSDPALTERFLQEAGIANAIKHRAIVPIGDDGLTEDGCAYLVLELLEGETLDEIRDRCNGRIPLEELAPIADELMSAIAAVHAAGIVHRDLKPGNVFVRKAADGSAPHARGRLKLLDFGTARIFDRSADSKLSVQGLVIGTPAYMAPEQARGSRAEVDAQSDVWSLGAMIFTLLTGEHVHVGRDTHQQLLMAATKAARSISSVDPSIDERVATAIDRALAYAKTDRWPDVQSMRVALRHAVVASVPTMRDLKAYVDVNADSGENALPAADDTTRDVTAGGEAFEDDRESMPGTVSLSDPTLVMARASLPDASSADAAALAAPLARPIPLDVPAPAHSESEAPAVSSTQGLHRPSRGIPLPALLLGSGAMAAVVLVVVFFLSGGDEPRKHAAATVPPAPDTSAPGPVIAEPAPSFIVITAPDDPPPKTTKHASAPVTRPAAPMSAPPKRAVHAASEVTTSAPPATVAVSADADAGVPATATTESEPAESAGAGGPTPEPPEPKGGAAAAPDPVDTPPSSP